MTRLSQGIGFACLASTLIAGAGCAPDTGSTVEQRSGALAAGDPCNLDILFMVDNSSSMTSMQMKLVAQDPAFMTVLKNFPNGLPNIHVAVVSSDMGAPGDSVNQIGHVAEAPGLTAVAEDRHRFVVESLANKGGDDSPISQTHPRTIGIEDPCDLDWQTVLAPIIEE